VVFNSIQIQELFLQSEFSQFTLNKESWNNLMEYLNQSASAINGRVMFYAKETDIPEIYGKISRPDTPINESSKMTLDQMFEKINGSFTSEIADSVTPTLSDSERSSESS
jgi:hypothetical protein